MEVEFIHRVQKGFGLEQSDFNGTHLIVLDGASSVGLLEWRSSDLAVCRMIFNSHVTHFATDTL